MEPDSSNAAMTTVVVGWFHELKATGSLGSPTFGQMAISAVIKDRILKGPPTLIILDHPLYTVRIGFGISF